MKMYFEGNIIKMWERDERALKVEHICSAPQGHCTIMTPNWGQGSVSYVLVLMWWRMLCEASGCVRFNPILLMWNALWQRIQVGLTKVFQSVVPSCEQRAGQSPLCHTYPPLSLSLS